MASVKNYKSITAGSAVSGGGDTSEDEEAEPMIQVPSTSAEAFRLRNRAAALTSQKSFDQESWKSERKPLLNLATENAKVFGARTPLIAESGGGHGHHGHGGGGHGHGHGGHDDHDGGGPPEKWSWLRIVKVTVLVALLTTFTILLLVIPEVERQSSIVTVSPEKPVELDLIGKINVPSNPSPGVIELTVAGSLIPENEYQFSVFPLTVSLIVEDNDFAGNETDTEEEMSMEWTVGILPPEIAVLLGEGRGTTTVSHQFAVPKDLDLSEDNITIVITSGYPEPLPLVVTAQLLSGGVNLSLVYGGIILVVMYVGIIFEVAHRTVVTMLAATGAIAVLAVINNRPTLEMIITWVDIETLVLLFSMMVIVSVMSETGLFNYIGYWTFKVTKGRLWPLIMALCVVTAVVSAFLDNVTTILLMTPVVIKLCERVNVDPVSVLIAAVIFSNIGGCATPVGDPPNVLIVNDPTIAASGISFASFTFHMLPCVVVVGVVNFFFLKYVLYRKLEDEAKEDDAEINGLRHEIVIWNRTAQSLSSFSKEESAVKEIVSIKVDELVDELERRTKANERRKSISGAGDDANETNLVSADYSITNKPLVVKTLVVLVIVVILFFLENVPELNLSLGWIALLGAIATLVLQDKANLESILARVEWTTLIFFATLFVVMEALNKLGLLKFIGDLVADAVASVPPSSQLPVAIALILWVSGIASAFIDNIPFATMMIPIVNSLSEDLKLPLTPLVYSLAFGCCLGGNGTLLGASANVVCAGVAEQHGYNFTFAKFFVVGMPITLVSLVISTAYLMICHVWFEWD